MSSDPSSSSNIEDFVTTNVYLELDIDFNKQVLKGFCDLSLDVLNRQSTILKLDARTLHIEKVLRVTKDSSNELQWELKPVTKVPSLGEVLLITVPSGEETLTLRIHYHTDPTASALQWLDPQQTLGRRYPYLFSQCQDIHARSIVPCQDTPAIKSTYQATITAPIDLMVLMSGIRQGVIQKNTKEGLSRHVFHQAMPIPIYLLAIVCGDLDSRELGPRSRVWCEPEMVADAAYEFEATESMICAAEALTGIPYAWERYDLLVLPPSFPFGGMENPCLTFVTPTLLAGDRSLVSVIAHEISHSWTGNLVTNSSWEHFWLNEGHTVYLERLILEALVAHSDPEEALKHRHLFLQLGYKDLCVVAEELPENFTRLVPDLSSVDPGDYFSRIPYEKGSLLLFHLECLVGKGNMIAWLKSYLNHFAKKSLNSDQWKDFFIKFMESKGISKDVLDSVDFHTWFYGGRTPAWKPNFNTTFTGECEELAGQWINHTPSEKAQDNWRQKYDSFTTHQKMYFWKQIRVSADKVSLETVKQMEEVYGMRKVNNAEIRFEWLLLCAAKRHEGMVENTLDFLNSQGRLKYTVPLYKLLAQWPAVRDKALTNFMSQRQFIHNNTAKRVEEIFAAK